LNTAEVPVGRGRLKLEAALELLGGADHIEGARGLDVGASTGGFTEGLLAHGAVHVVALDVGRGQLHERLRADPRVTCIEGVHFKTAPLRIAAGPFDYFTVDVSFIAARNMLRPLAFRLREGAEGIILVKPQFEVPEGYVRKGRVKAEGLREWALDRVRQKGEALGFSLLGHADSPVPVESGTVEILTRWRFRGPPASIAAAMDRRGPAAEGGWVTETLVTTEMTCTVVSDRGLEKAVLEEVSRVPAVRVVKTREEAVEIVAGAAALERLHLAVRSGLRLQVRAGRFRVRSLEDLAREVRRLPWTRFAGSARRIRVSVAARGQKALSPASAAPLIEAAVRRSVGVSSDSSDPELHILASCENERWTFEVDASGKAASVGSAALAAGVLSLCRWEPGVPLIDPLCGDGEAIIAAGKRALGLPASQEIPAFLSWPGFDDGRYRGLLDDARRGTSLRPSICGFDPHPPAVEAARLRAEGAGVARALAIEANALDGLSATGPRGLVLTMPGIREPGAAGAMLEWLALLGEALRARFEGWTAGVLVEEAGRDRRAIGLRTVDEHRLLHGGRPLTLLRFRL
jgi:23S rRNA (cytidine1920-2'-O)/16S rRNA (cytidine1409-2'-O)-methyltransferase